MCACFWFWPPGRIAVLFVVVAYGAACHFHVSDRCTERSCLLLAEKNRIRELTEPSFAFRFFARPISCPLPSFSLPPIHSRNSDPESLQALLPPSPLRFNHCKNYRIPGTRDRGFEIRACAYHADVDLQQKSGYVLYLLIQIEEMTRILRSSTAVLRSIIPGILQL